MGENASSRTGGLGTEGAWTFAKKRRFSSMRSSNSSTAIGWSRNGTCAGVDSSTQGREDVKVRGVQAKGVLSRRQDVESMGERPVGLEDSDANKYGEDDHCDSCDDDA